MARTSSAKSSYIYTKNNGEGGYNTPQMKTITLIIILQLIVTLLTGCSQLETKLEEMNQLNCKPVDSSLCAGFEG